MPEHTPPRGNPLSVYGLRSFISFCRPWRYKILLLTLVFAVSNAALAVQPIFIGKLVDAISQSAINHAATWWIAAILIGTSIIHDVLWRAAEFLYRGLLLPISFHYETFLFRSVIRKPYPYFVDKFTGKIGSYITSMSNEIKWLLDDAMFSYVGSLVSVISVIAIMTSINWQTGLIIVGCLAFMLVIGRYTLARDMAMQKVEADFNSTKNGHIIDSIANFVSVKSFQKEERELHTVSAQQLTTLAAAKRSFFWGIMFWGSQSLAIRYVMWPGIILLNLWMLLRGDISVGQFTTVLSTALLFSETIWEVVWNISQLGKRVSKVEEAHQYLFGNVNIAKEAANEHIVQPRKRSFKQEFTVSNLSFAYPDKPDQAVLHDITINLRHGEKLGIVGKSGSGKSTLVGLLLGHYDTPAATFNLDSKHIKSRELSRLIAYVPQDTALFHRTIAENIAYASNKNISQQQVIAAAKKAQADEFIRKLPDGYDTLVGERGVKLSGGQRQRIAIARAMLDNAPILVLDEATSALDSETEVYVQKALETLWNDKTVIAIAHRLSTLRTMDRIIVMDNGRIIEQGTHAELIKQGGTYAKLWNHQSGGFIEE